MAMFKWLTVCFLLLNMTACGSHSYMLKIDLVSHGKQFEFITNNPNDDAATSVRYEATNPMCQEIEPGPAHGPGLPTFERRQFWVDLDFDGSVVMVEKAQPSQALCNYELAQISTIISSNGMDWGGIQILAADNGPTEIDIYCHVPILDEREFSCREKDGLYRGTFDGMPHICGGAVCLELNLESEAITIHVHSEEWDSSKDPDRSEDANSWQKKFRQR